MKAKKWLGQNFLKNKKILEEIVSAGEVSKNDIILEVGPGHGELTEFLARSAKKVIAVEKDRDLIPELEEKFRNTKNVEIISGDILKINNFKFLIPNSNFKIIANIPYYITSRFLRLFLSQTKFRPRLMALMVQYEVAKRICAKPPEINLLALSVQVYGKPWLIKKVSRHYFKPPPKVDSAIIKISEISDGWFQKNGIKPEKFFEILHRAFRQKRKMLRASLKNFAIPQEYEKRRPEELSLEDWAKFF